VGFVMAGAHLGPTSPTERLAFASAARLVVTTPQALASSPEARSYLAHLDSGSPQAGGGAQFLRPSPRVLLREETRIAPTSPLGAYPSARMSRVPDEPRTAIIHYWLVGMRGGERVLERLIRLFPRADIFTHVYDPAAVSERIRERPVRTTFIQNLPGSRRHYQKYLPLMPLALEQLDLRGYDLILSSESGPAKGVIVPPGALHVCYCHSPMRYLWDHYLDYLRSAGGLTRLAIPWLMHSLRGWDYASSARVDRFIANSSFIQQRIEKAYRRPSAVVHPPVEVSLFQPSHEIDAHYLWVGQMTPYKRADLAVDAFNELGLPLLMVGQGEMLRDLTRKARPNIKILPRLSFDELRQAYARCRALVFTAEEDFGMVPVEAMASGRPVLAYGHGGVLDTVTPGSTGLYFEAQTKESLVAAVRDMEGWLPDFDPADAVRSAARFAPERFDEGVLAVIAGLPAGASAQWT
jgi:glycosyltransferase involved in cell wall biosynthesis